MERGIVCTGLLSLVLGGCATVIGSTLVKDGEPTGRIVIVNNTGVNLDVMTLSRCSAMSYGLNRLGGGQSIPDGTTMSVNLGAGCWDVQVGKTGTCNQSGCRWLEGTQRKIEVAPGYSQRIVWGPGS